MKSYNGVSKKRQQSASLDLEREQNRIATGALSFADAARQIQELCAHGANGAAKKANNDSMANINAEILSDAMALNSAATLEDINYKIEAWLVMAPPTVKDINHASCEELLAYSIMVDVKKLASSANGKSRLAVN